MRTSHLPLATLPANPEFVLHATTLLSSGKHHPVVLGDELTPDEAFHLIDGDDEEAYGDLLLCGDDGQEYVPCFTRRGWVVVPR